MKKVAAFFPGQTSQYIGMGVKLWENSEIANTYFNNATNFLETDIKEICINSEKLKQTEYSQIAVFVHSVAAFFTYRETSNDEFYAFAGHSVGEFAALVCSGAVDYLGGLKLIQERAKIMGKSCKKNDYAMAVVVGISNDKLRTVCDNYSEHDSYIDIACDNNSIQKIISGERIKIQECVEYFLQQGVYSKVISNIGPFHTNYMKQAQKEFTRVLSSTEFASTSGFVMSNVTGYPYPSICSIKSLLNHQMTSRVRWSNIINYLSNKRFTKYIEFGPSNILTKILSEDYPNFSALSTDNIYNNLI